jgi:hypothetical protein
LIVEAYSSEVSSVHVPDLNYRIGADARKVATFDSYHCPVRNTRGAKNA